LINFSGKNVFHIGLQSNFHNDKGPYSQLVIEAIRLMYNFLN
jgi:hypothetical protein